MESARCGQGGGVGSRREGGDDSTVRRLEGGDDLTVRGWAERFGVKVFL